VVHEDLVKCWVLGLNVILCELPHCENRWAIISLQIDNWPPICETFILRRKLCVVLKNGSKRLHFSAQIPLKPTPALGPKSRSQQAGVCNTHCMVTHSLKGWIQLLPWNLTLVEWFGFEIGLPLSPIRLRFPGRASVQGFEAVHSCLRYVKHWVPIGSNQSLTAALLQHWLC